MAGLQDPMFSKERGSLSAIIVIIVIYVIQWERKGLGMSVLNINIGMKIPHIVITFITLGQVILDLENSNVLNQT